jgi:phenylalanyl-tRNA synthetase beta chain
LTLNSDNATLTEEQIEAAVQAVLAQLASALGARQRA